MKTTLQMRVIMPALEKQQMDEAGMVDKLLPPEDPLKPRRVTRKKPVFEETVRPPLSPIFPSGRCRSVWGGCLCVGLCWCFSVEWLWPQ